MERFNNLKDHIYTHSKLNYSSKYIAFSHAHICLNNATHLKRERERESCKATSKHSIEQTIVSFIYRH
jgi:hypothetical protein